MDMTLKQGTGRGGKRGGLRGRIRTEVTLGDGTVLAPLPQGATAEQKKERSLALARERARRVHALKRGDTEKAKITVGLGRTYATEGLTLHITEVKESNSETKAMPRAVLTQAIKFKQAEAKRCKNVIVQGTKVWGSAAERSKAIADYLRVPANLCQGQAAIAERFGCVKSTVSKVWAKVQAGTI